MLSIVLYIKKSLPKSLHSIYAIPYVYYFLASSEAFNKYISQNLRNHIHL